MARSSSQRITAARATPRGVIIVYTVAAVLALLGLADALYLTILHVTGQSAACGGSAACSQVLASKYAHLGPIPVAGLGLLAYFTAFSCAVLSAFSYLRARTGFAAMVAVMFLGTLWFLYLQAFVLHAYCRYCLFSAAITFLLAGIAVATPRK